MLIGGRTGRSATILAVLLGNSHGNVVQRSQIRCASARQEAGIIRALHYSIRPRHRIDHNHVQPRVRGVCPWVGSARRRPPATCVREQSFREQRSNVGVSTRLLRLARDTGVVRGTGVLLHGDGQLERHRGSRALQRGVRVGERVRSAAGAADRGRHISRGRRPRRRADDRGSRP